MSVNLPMKSTTHILCGLLLTLIGPGMLNGEEMSPQDLLRAAISIEKESPPNWKIIDTDDQEQWYLEHGGKIYAKGFWRTKDGVEQGMIIRPEGSYSFNGGFIVKQDWSEPQRPTHNPQHEKANSALIKLGSILDLDGSAGVTYQQSVENKFGIDFTVIDVVISNSASKQIDSLMNEVVDAMADMKEPTAKVDVKASKIRFWIRKSDNRCLGREVYSANGTQISGTIYKKFESGVLSAKDFGIGNYQMTRPKANEGHLEALSRALRESEKGKK